MGMVETIKNYTDLILNNEYNMRKLFLTIRYIDDTYTVVAYDKRTAAVTTWHSYYSFESSEQSSAFFP